MHRLRGSPCIIVLLFYFSCLWRDVSSKCPVQCDCNDEILRVTCSEAGLEYIPIMLNPGLKELHLNKNHISGITSSSIDVYRVLQFLDVSHNQLTSLGRNSFKKLKHLKILLLGNNMISTLQNDTFHGLESLQVLQMNENFLEKLSGGVFAPLTQLEKLDLSQNRISSIDEDAFMGLESLTTLLLRDNKLTNIPTTAFRHVRHLVSLDLGRNPFHKLPESSFSPLAQLEELTLDGCGIRTIEYGAFKWLTSLLVLRLHDNDLDDIPTKSFFDVTRLEVIHIGQNDFRHLKPLTFQRLKYLRTIEIVGARNFESIQKGAFDDNANLEKIVMTHNKNFRHIDKGTFSGLAHLRHVSFRGNAFQTFDYGLLPWDELEVLDLRDNPLRCNCSLLWLWNLLREKNFSSSPQTGDVKQVTCSLASDKEEVKMLRELKVSELECYDGDTKRQIIIVLVVVSCVVAAVIVTLGFRFRDRVAVVLKSRWSGGRKEPQYQKTPGDEESNILHPAHHAMKLTPVTEL